MPRMILPEPGRAGVPIYVWGRRIPPGALDQLRKVASQPWTTGHVAAMPDLHVSQGIAVGTVFATKDTVVPTALGGDLGCGMAAVRFDSPAPLPSTATLRRLIDAMTLTIPTGDATHRGEGHELPAELLASPLSTSALSRVRDRFGPRHLGTLGGGNHFIELDRDATGALWLLVHSGSRGLGAAIAAHHLKAAHASGTGDVPGLRVDTKPGEDCLADIQWALRFARANRDALLLEAAAVIEEITGHVPDLTSRIDVHHNFVRVEHPHGERVLVHRKGAIAAPEGERALIPGSMATASYIVEGQGEPLSFCSASHGAGRVMTRREARARIPRDRFMHSMRRVVFDHRKQASLVEEAAAAYRDIGEVLEDERDLVRPLLRLEPLAVLKG